MTEQASMDMVWALVDRIQREEGMLTPRAIAKMHAVMDDCNTDYFPDLSTQTAQAKWIKQRIDREEGGGSNSPTTNNQQDE